MDELGALFTRTLNAHSYRAWGDSICACGWGNVIRDGTIEKFRAHVAAELVAALGAEHWGYRRPDPRASKVPVYRLRGVEGTDHKEGTE